LSLIIPSKLKGVIRRQFHQHVDVQLFRAKDKKSCLFFKTNFSKLFHVKIVLVVPFRKSHLAVLASICKPQLAVHKKRFLKAACKNVVEIDPLSCLLANIRLG
jgi:hypothetical protein